MAVILDGDVVIRGEKGTFDLKTWAASLPDERFDVTLRRTTVSGHDGRSAIRDKVQQRPATILPLELA